MAHEVHVWTVLLSQVGSGISELSDLLSPEEKQKASRFMREEDRKRSLVTHGVLRQLLGRYLGLAPQHLKFLVNAFGKPALIQAACDQPLSFNLTHSGDVILFGVATGRRIGVDVEMIRAELNIMELAEGQFSSQELAALRATETLKRPAAFFRGWTRKEAYVKARGEGLGFALDQFSVALGENEAPAVLWAADDPAVSERWSMFDFSAVPGYAGAVVVEGKEARIVPYAYRCSTAV